MTVLNIFITFEMGHKNNPNGYNSSTRRFGLVSRKVYLQKKTKEKSNDKFKASTYVPIRKP